jgi:hypothetical protein
MGNELSKGQGTVILRWQLGMYATLKMQEVAQEMIHYKTDIIALEEIRW